MAKVEKTKKSKAGVAKEPDIDFKISLYDYHPNHDLHMCNMRVNPGVSLEEDLARIWSTAGHLYRQAADVVYRTDDGQDIDAEVADLLGILNARGVS